VLSLYTGAGGLDHGLKAAGFQIAVANDIDHDSCETLRCNGAKTVIEGDILGIPTSSLLRAGGLDFAKADLLVGGPPCQPFSKSGYWASGDTRRLDDPRARTLTEFLRVLEEALPSAFLLENVDGLAYTGKSEGLGLLLDAVEAINDRAGTRYRPSYTVLNAADFGVPQTRRRLFVVASRDGREFEFPRDLSTLDPHEVPRTSPGGQSFYRGAWDALADAVVRRYEDLRVRGKWGRLLPSIPEGQNYLWHTDRGGGLPLFGWRRRYWGFLLKLAKDAPSWTIQAQPGPAIGPFHWHNRRLSEHELLRLQTFPDNTKIVGSRVSVQRQIGNAVPSLLAEVLGREIRRQLLDGTIVSGPLSLLPVDRSPAPAPEPIEDVPVEYHELVGSHEPHPGTGQGNAARRRLQLH
jgi:DNA (cytosine-5)-methyltransferase 1